MTDPFEALHLPPRPVDPDAGFAERLRERLERLVLLGEEMTTSARRADYAAVTPYLAFRDSRAAIDFYVDVFGASRRGEPVVMPDGSVGHAEIALGGSVLMLADESPEYDHVAPVATGVRPMHRVEVDDVDRVVERAEDRGARVLRPAADTGHGYSGTILDPFGYRWMVAARAGADRSTARGGGPGGEPQRAAQGEGEQGAQVGQGGRGGGPGSEPPVAAQGSQRRQGSQSGPGSQDGQDGQDGEPQVAAQDGQGGRGGERVAHGHVGYYTLTVPDDEAAKRFYGAVLGWTFPRGRVERAWGIEGAGLPMSGLWGGQAWAGWKLMYAVDDLDAALARVREHGGTTREPEQQAYGLAAECADDQGVEFWLWQQ